MRSELEKPVTIQTTVYKLSSVGGLLWGDLVVEYPSISVGWGDFSEMSRQKVRLVTMTSVGLLSWKTASRDAISCRPSSYDQKPPWSHLYLFPMPFALFHSGTFTISISLGVATGQRQRGRYHFPVILGWETTPAFLPPVPIDVPSCNNLSSLSFPLSADLHSDNRWDEYNQPSSRTICRSPFLFLRFLKQTLIELSSNLDRNQDINTDREVFLTKVQTFENPNGCWFIIGHEQYPPYFFRWQS